MPKSRPVENGFPVLVNSFQYYAVLRLFLGPMVNDDSHTLNRLSRLLSELLWPENHAWGHKSRTPTVSQ